MSRRAATRTSEPSSPEPDPGTPPVSVILPTRDHGPVIEEVADQLTPGDELLVIADGESDPVVDADAGADLPDGVRVVLAGEPEGCSGKANAIAAGMEAATADRIVWTDDDFRHPEGWLARLRADYEHQGPTSELPFFVGRDPLSVLLEPTYVLGGTVGVYVRGFPWAGGVIFDRDDLDGEAAFRRDLRRTVSDDGLLGDRLDVTSATRVRRVGIGGSVRASLERHARFIKIARFHDPVGIGVGGTLAAAVTGAGLLFPVPVFVLSTLLLALVYAAFGLRRWTFLLAYPAVLASVPLLAYGLLRRSFVWGGRRYYWRGKFDVTVEPDESDADR